MNDHDLRRLFDPALREQQHQAWKFEQRLVWETRCERSVQAARHADLLAFHEAAALEHSRRMEMKQQAAMQHEAIRIYKGCR